MKGGYKSDGSGQFNNTGAVENTGLIADIVTNKTYSNIVENRAQSNYPLGSISS